MPSIEQLKQLESLDPQDPFVPYALALEFAKVQDHDAAIDAFDRCLALDPDYLYAYFHKARSLDAAGRRDDAIDALQIGAGKAKTVGDAKASAELDGYLADLR